jgi:TolA-binding protein
MVSSYNGGSSSSSCTIGTMGSLLILGSLLLADVAGAATAAAGTASTTTDINSNSNNNNSRNRFNPIENLFQPLARPQQQQQQQQQQQSQQQQNESSNNNNKIKSNKKPELIFDDPNAPTVEEREAEREARMERNRQRRTKVVDAMKKVRPDTSKIEKVSSEELEKLSEEHPNEFRKLWGGRTSNGEHLIQYADPGDDYDMWQQAYRMLGGFIDCDHQKSDGSGDDGGGSGDGDDQACSRWMMWASVSKKNNICIYIYIYIYLHMILYTL